MSKKISVVLESVKCLKKDDLVGHDEFFVKGVISPSDDSGCPFSFPCSVFISESLKIDKHSGKIHPMKSSSKEQTIYNAEKTMTYYKH